MYYIFYINRKDGRSRFLLILGTLYKEGNDSSSFFFANSLIEKLMELEIIKEFVAIIRHALNLNWYKIVKLPLFYFTTQLLKIIF